MFETEVGTQTSPTVPVMVNVRLVPGLNVNPLRDQMYLVPPVTSVGPRTAKPAGSSVVSLSITGEMVSVTTRLVRVAEPTFVTTTR